MRRPPVGRRIDLGGLEEVKKQVCQSSDYRTKGECDKRFSESGDGSETQGIHYLLHGRARISIINGCRSVIGLISGLGMVLQTLE